MDGSWGKGIYRFLITLGVLIGLAAAALGWFVYGAVQHLRWDR